MFLCGIMESKKSKTGIDRKNFDTKQLKGEIVLLFGKEINNKLSLDTIPHFY